MYEGVRAKSPSHDKQVTIADPDCCTVRLWSVQRRQCGIVVSVFHSCGGQPHGGMVGSPVPKLVYARNIMPTGPASTSSVASESWRGQHSQVAFQTRPLPARLELTACERDARLIVPRTAVAERQTGEREASPRPASMSPARQVQVWVEPAAGEEL